MIQGGGDPPTDCGPMTSSYQIQVKDGSGAIVALATVAEGTFSRSESHGNVTVECDATYTASMPASPVYTFVLVDAGNSSNIRDSETTSGEGPPLSVIETFCPEC